MDGKGLRMVYISSIKSWNTNEIVQSCGKGKPVILTLVCHNGVWYLSESQTMYLQAGLPHKISKYLYLCISSCFRTDQHNVYGFMLPCRCQETHLDPHPLSVLWSPNLYGTVVLPGLPKIQRQPATMPEVFLEETVWCTCLQFKLRKEYQL